MEDIVPVDFPLNKTNLTVNVQCSSCRHFKGTPVNGQRKTCVNLGILEESKPCASYAVNVDQVRLGDEPYVKILTSVIKNLPRKKLHLVAALLIQEHHTRKFDFHIGEPVYFVMMGGDYLENYRNGWVIAADRNYVYISARQNDNSVSLSLMHQSVIKKKKWKERRKQLIKQGRITDPQQHVYKMPQKDMKKLASYVPPTIDSLTDERVKINPALSARRGVDIQIKDAVQTISIRRKAS